MTVGGECATDGAAGGARRRRPSTIAIRMATARPFRCCRRWWRRRRRACARRSSSCARTRTRRRTTGRWRGMRTLGRDAHADKSDEQARIEERVVAQETTRHVPDLQQRLADRAPRRPRPGLPGRRARLAHQLRRHHSPRRPVATARDSRWGRTANCSSSCERQRRVGAGRGRRARPAHVEQGRRDRRRRGAACRAAVAAPPLPPPPPPPRATSSARWTWRRAGTGPPGRARCQRPRDLREGVKIANQRRAAALTGATRAHRAGGGVVVDRGGKLADTARRAATSR